MSGHPRFVVAAYVTLGFAGLWVACGEQESALEDSEAIHAEEQVEALVADGGVAPDGGSLPQGSADCGATGKKVAICHYPPGNPANAHTLCVGAPAVKAHVRNHGDTVGPCGAGDAGASADAGAQDLDAGSLAPPDAGGFEGFDGGPF